MASAPEVLAAASNSPLISSTFARLLSARVSDEAIAARTRERYCLFVHALRLVEIAVSLGDQQASSARGRV